MKIGAVAIMLLIPNPGAKIYQNMYIEATLPSIAWNGKGPG